MTNKKTDYDYAFYSKPLKQVFDSLDALKAAEAKHFAELKAKENKAATKKADAVKVEDAFKALNAARKTYKEELTQLTTEYRTAVAELNEAFEAGRADIRNTLAAAEDAYSTALKEFTDKYPEGFHVTLKDGDFETTISGQNKIYGNKDLKKENRDLFNIFDLLFNV